jgi:hypothetical protein
LFILLRSTQPPILCDRSLSAVIPAKAGIQGNWARLGNFSGFPRARE